MNNKGRKMNGEPAGHQRSNGPHEQLEQQPQTELLHGRQNFARRALHTRHVTDDTEHETRLPDSSTTFSHPPTGLVRASEECEAVSQH